MQTQPMKERATWIDTARVLAMFVIVFSHIKYLGTGDATILGDVLWYMQFDGRVYFFILIAGYFTPAASSYGKLANRFLGLLIPFILWNLIIFFVSPTVLNQEVFLGTPSFPFPADIPLWFLRDILLCTLLSPLFRLLKRYWVPLIAILLIMQDHWFELSKHYVLTSPSSIGFFLLGQWLHQFSLSRLRAAWQDYAPVFLIFSLPIGIYYGLCYGLHWFDNFRVPISSFERFAGILTLVSCAMVIDKYLPRVSEKIRKLTPACFFIFASHYLVYLIIAHHFNTNVLDDWLLLWPIIIFISCALCFFVIRRAAPFLLPLLAHEKCYQYFKQ